jgi:hypothetical protein
MQTVRFFPKVDRTDTNGPNRLAMTDAYWPGQTASRFRRPFLGSHRRQTRLQKDHDSSRSCVGSSSLRLKGGEEPAGPACGEDQYSPRLKKKMATVVMTAPNATRKMTSNQGG